MWADFIRIGIGHLPADGTTVDGVIYRRVIAVAVELDRAQCHLIIRHGIGTGQRQRAGIIAPHTRNIGGVHKTQRIAERFAGADADGSTRNVRVVQVGQDYRVVNRGGSSLLGVSPDQTGAGHRHIVHRRDVDRRSNCGTGGCGHTVGGGIGHRPADGARLDRVVDRRVVACGIEGDRTERRGVVGQGGIAGQGQGSSAINAGDAVLRREVKRVTGNIVANDNPGTVHQRIICVRHNIHCRIKLRRRTLLCIVQRATGRHHRQIVDRGDGQNRCCSYRVSSTVGGATTVNNREGQGTRRFAGVDRRVFGCASVCYPLNETIYCGCRGAGVEVDYQLTAVHTGKGAVYSAYQDVVVPNFGAAYTYLSATAAFVYRTQLIGLKDVARDLDGQGATDIVRRRINIPKRHARVHDRRQGVLRVNAGTQVDQGWSIVGTVDCYGQISRVVATNPVVHLVGEGVNQALTDGQCLHRRITVGQGIDV